VCRIKNNFPFCQWFMVPEEVRQKLSINDCISLQTGSGLGLGLIIEDSQVNVEVIMFNQVTSSLHWQYSLRPVTADKYPMAYCSNMTEVMANVSDKKTIPRTSILDIVFIAPIKEVESSYFHIAGSTSVYFIKYYIESNGCIKDCDSTFYFRPFTVEPFSHRIFSSFNVIAQNLRRSMHHLKQTDLGSKTFHIFFSMESFIFLSSKLPSAIHVCAPSKESSIIYHNNLKMEARSGVIMKHYIRVLHTPSMSELQKVLGTAVGLGMSSARPTKKAKYKYCTINSILNSVELHRELPLEVISSPLRRTGCNGVDFVYWTESRQLVCTIRFTKIIVSNAEIATSRVPSCDVKPPKSSAYVGAWFIYDGAVLEVVSIAGNIVACISLVAKMFQYSYL